jgi:hypothetical protein
VEEECICALRGGGGAAARRPHWVDWGMGTEAEEGERDCDGAAAVDTGEGRRAWQRTPGLSGKFRPARKA